MENTNRANACPCNTKSLLAFLFNTMEQVAEGNIKSQDAIAISKLASNALGTLNYELKRSVVEMQLSAIGGKIADKAPRLREIESKILIEQ